MGKGCSCCDGKRKDHKNFRQDHGGGPEVAKHRKKGGKKRERSDHKHDYVKTEHRYLIWGGKEYIYYSYKCIECGRRR